VKPTVILSVASLTLALLLSACNRKDDGTMRLVDRSAPPPVSPAEEPPVAINPVSPVRYPAALLEQGIEGQVLLRLYVDSLGQVIPDSTRLEESSGYPALDSAALAASPELRFSPALHQGRPIAAPFIQPVQFRGRARRRNPSP
jgi:TonB family protein